MDYARKLLIAKILVTIGMVIFTIAPLFVYVGANMWGNILAFPVFMYVLWGSLHGTGRSVRLVAFIGMAYTIGNLISAGATDIQGIASVKPLLGSIFGILTLGVLISLKPRSTAK